MYEQKVAIDIVKESFGDDVTKVFEFLVQRGKSSYKVINQSLNGKGGLTIKRIKQSLLVLIQHNLVTYEEFLLPLSKEEVEQLKPGEPLPSDSVYEAIIVNAIHRLRFPKFINYIKYSKGDEAAYILEELIDHGRLPMDLLIKQASQIQRVDSFEDQDEITKRFEDTFTKLIMDQFIMRAPRPRPISDQETSNALSKEAKKIGSGAGGANQKKESDPFALPTVGTSSNGPLSSGSDNNDSESLEILTGKSSIPLQPKKNSAKKSSAKSKSTTTSTTSTSPSSIGRKRKSRDILEEDDEEPDLLVIEENVEINVNDHNVVNKNTATTTTTAKTIGSNGQHTLKKSKLDLYGQKQLDGQQSSRQQQQGAMDQRLVDESRVLWTINYEQFIIEFKLKACYDFVTEKNNQQSGLLFNAMVKLCKRSIRSNQDSLTSCVYGENILEEYNRDLDPSKKMDKLQIEKYLSIMQASRPSMVTKMVSKSKQSTSSELGAYQVNVGNIIGIIKQKMVESIIKQKFGDNGLRVFKLLLIKNLLEPKQIAELAMIPPNECKALLFNMMQKNIIRLQEIPRSSDHFANRTFYLFFVDLPTIIATFTEDIFKAIYNTRERLKSELEPHKDALEKLSQLDENQITEDQAKIYKKTDRITQTLLTVILNLDNDLLHLYSF
ncbi:hypothetical protein RB653_007559 [Dictyostelium firmibasis]|uniref:DNA-directed RNA polymerase III subunit RPC3 n=1 Tax=Dictyostelium firmibasis TaxID=79012 RepID=A0AAN7TUS1_9MYCE